MLPAKPQATAVHIQSSWMQLLTLTELSKIGETTPHGIARLANLFRPADPSSQLAASLLRDYGYVSSKEYHRPHRFYRQPTRSKNRADTGCLRMEMRGIEPLTPWLQTTCSPS
jgi:hypothetical protein